MPARAAEAGGGSEPVTDAEACRADAAVRPDRAVPGQQILYTARIVRREDVGRIDWERPLSFPGFRAEWLPGRAEDTSMRYRGVAWWAREEHRALFAARPGRFTIPPAALRCRLEARGPSGPTEVLVEVPAVEVRIDPVPEDRRPAGWHGLVGPLQVQAVAEPRALTLGGTVSLSVQLRGTGNLWIVDSPLGPSSVEGGEVFARMPELAFDEGERLGVRRYFRYRIVPRRTGILQIPALRFPYYDPSLRRFSEAVTAPLELRVAERPAAGPGDPTPGRDGAPDARRDAGPRPWGSRTAWTLALLAAGVAGGLLAAARLRRGRAHDWKAVDAALDAARRAAGAGDPPAEARELARALRAALQVAVPRLAPLEPRALREAASRATGEIEGPLLVEIAAQLEALDWIRFSGELGHPDRDAARRVIETLRRRGREGTSGGASVSASR